MATLKRKAPSLETKVKILRAVDSGRKKKDAAEDFKIPPRTLSTLLSSRKKIEETYANSTLKGDRKRDRPSHYPDVEEALFSWFKDVRARNLPVSGALLQTKAVSLACLLGHHDFRASSGWLQRFKNRHEIVCHTLSGEGSAVNLDSCEKWLENFRPLLQEYEERNVYNVDKTGVFQSRRRLRDVQQMCKNLRDSFKKNYEEAMKSRMSCAGAVQVVHVKWPYLGKLLFLQDAVAKRP
ncbi:tigger transposable element-derived protein 6-like [Ixodes scapularis]